MSESDQSFTLVIWMNQPSYYQTAFFRELAAQPEVSRRCFMQPVFRLPERRWAGMSPSLSHFHKRFLRRSAPGRVSGTN